MLLVFTLPFVFHTATLVSVGLLIPLIAWIVKIIMKEEKFNLTPLFLPIILWGGAILISALNSVNPQYSFNEFRGEYLKQVLLFFLITNSIKGNDKLRYLIYTLLLSSFFVSSFAIVGYFTGITAPQGRTEGTYGSITRQAMYFLFLIPITFGIFLHSKSRFIKQAGFWLFLLSSCAMLMTFIRAVWLVCAILVLILAFRKNMKKGLIALLCMFVLTGTVPKVRQRITDSFNFSKDINKLTSGRIGLIMNSFAVIKDYPWTGAGYGPNIFRYLAEDYNLTDTPNLPPPTPLSRQEPDAHNLYFQLTVETGIIGIMTFLYLLFVFYKFTLKALHQMKENHDILFILILSVSGVLLYGLAGYFYEDRNGLLFWLFISLAVSIIHNEGKGEIIL